MYRRSRVLLLLIAWGYIFGGLGSTAYSASSPYILVADYFANRIGKYDATTGASLGVFATITRPDEMLVGPDGALYVTSYGASDSAPHSIVRFDLTSGANLGVFASAGANSTIRGFDFGANGNLFVADVSSGTVVQFDGHTGANLGAFVSNIEVPIAVRFGPDGVLFVARGHNQVSPHASVLRFDGTTGAPEGVFTDVGIETPQNLLFGPNGDLYVANQLAFFSNTTDVTRYDGGTGAIQTFSASVTGDNPQGLAFLPNGNLLVSNGGAFVQRFDAESGAFFGNFIQGGSFFGGIVFVPEPTTGFLWCTSVLAFVGLCYFRRCRRALTRQ